jgi:hypothetical protein
MDAVSARNAEQVLREAVNINYAFSYDFDQVLSRFKKPLFSFFNPGFND